MLGGKGVRMSQKNEWCMSLFYVEGKCVEQQISTVTTVLRCYSCERKAEAKILRHGLALGCERAFQKYKAKPRAPRKQG